MTASDRNTTKRSFWIGVFLTIGFGVLYWAHDHLRLVVNRTESLPYHIFLVLLNDIPERGEYVMFTPPGTIDSPLPFTKQVAGLPGDVISYDRGNIFINSQVIGFVKPISLKGTPLEPTPPGTIPPGQYFVTTTHQDSYDSRYKILGLVGRDSIIGRAIPLL